MHLFWMDNSNELAERAARYLAELLKAKPDAAIALPTGNSPLGLYRRLAEMHDAGQLPCRHARFFNLDEFVGKSADDPPSFGAVLWKRVLRPLGVKPAQVRLLRGDAVDLAAECRGFEQAIAEAGGLDLAILGVGANGHIAFNEPGSDWGSFTREVSLTEATRRAQLGLFATEADVPRRGLTMGIRTIWTARAILLLISGAGKEGVVAALSRARPNKEWPVTAILGHRNLTVLAINDLNPARSAGQSRTDQAR